MTTQVFFSRLSGIRSVFVNTLIVGKSNRNLIDVESKLNDTKLAGDEIIVQSYKNRLTFSSALRFFTKNGPLLRYAKNST